MLFSIVIPLVPQHDSYFFGFLSELFKSAENVGEVIASRSSGNSEDMIKFDEKLAELRSSSGNLFPVRVLHSTDNLLAGENRNRAWDVAEYDYVVFCDADDSYSPYRLKMLEDAIERFQPDLIVHDYFSGSRPVEYEYQEPDKLEYVLSSEIFEATFLGKPRKRASEGKYSGDTNIRVPFKLDNHVKIHHAHSCVRTSLRKDFRFGDTFRAEDGQFCRDILESNRRVIYIPWELSTWIYSRSTAPSHNLQTPRKIFNRIKKAVTSPNRRLPTK